MEQMNDGKKIVSTEKLDLVAKDPDAKNIFTHVTIWVDPARDVSLKQQFFHAFRRHPDGDVYEYSLQRAEAGGYRAFAIKTDKKTTVDSQCSF